MADSIDNDAAQDDLRFVTDLRAALEIASAASSLSPPSHPDRLLEMIVRAAARAIPSPEGALMLIDQERQVLTFDVVIGSTAETVRDLTVPLGHGIAGLVAISGQALAIANAQEDPRHAKDVAEQSGYLPTTILAVPVVMPDGAPVGVLELLDRQQQPTFDLADMELLAAFADQLSLVLDFRRSHDLLGARVGQAIAGLGGLPAEMSTHLTTQAETFTARVQAGEESRRTNELAELVTSIASRGPAEHDACMAVLKAFADYIETTPSLGMGLFG